MVCYLVIGYLLVLALRLFLTSSICGALEGAELIEGGLLYKYGTLYIWKDTLLS